MDPRVKPEDDECSKVNDKRGCWRLASSTSTIVILGLDPRIHAVTVAKRDPAQYVS